MQVVVETGALTPLCDDGKSWPGHEAHEQQDVDVTCLPAGQTKLVEGMEFQMSYFKS